MQAAMSYSGRVGLPPITNKMDRRFVSQKEVVHPTSDRISYIRDDLFKCPVTDSMAHCISADCRMGAGIAVAFKKRFQRVEEIKRQNKPRGDVAVLENNKRYIYYLVTKNRASEKPTEKDLQRSLEAMKDHALLHLVTSISMPKIGCGLDRLKWERVSCILEDVFKNTNVKITVYYL
ncbi:ADP-ribose glycohydrolase OARD1 [Bombina bombina]|uniref:ADP-ribose glycohydrolase OARD1 n=1 Tax=Bombina bombina TaxID=8345 RepID=UPI00235AA6B1|nr:ADP-ribose glycohydrolase OARD1 [Bombina bombina]